MSAPSRVHLLGYPVELGMSVVEHVEDWMREFKLMALSRAEGTATHDVPERLQAMVDALSRRYDSDLSEADRLRAAAAARGDETVDLSYPVRPETEDAVLAWRTMLDQVDAYCRAEDLLTLQRNAEQVRLQDWITGQFLSQLRGRPPLPWRPVPHAEVVLDAGTAEQRTG